MQASESRDIVTRFDAETNPAHTTRDDINADCAVSDEVGLSAGVSQVTIPECARTGS